MKVLSFSCAAKMRKRLSFQSSSCCFYFIYLCQKRRGSNLLTSNGIDTDLLASTKDSCQSNLVIEIGQFLDEERRN